MNPAVVWQRSGWPQSTIDGHVCGIRSITVPFFACIAIQSSCRTPWQLRSRAFGRSLKQRKRDATGGHKAHGVHIGTVLVRGTIVRCERV